MRPDIISREKASSHRLAPGRIYSGQVRAVSSVGKITVYVPELTSSYGDLVALNTTNNNQYSVGDTVKCIFADEFFRELIVLGAARIQADKFPTIQQFNTLSNYADELFAELRKIRIYNIFDDI